MGPSIPETETTRPTAHASQARPGLRRQRRWHAAAPRQLAAPGAGPAEIALGGLAVGLALAAALAAAPARQPTPTRALLR